MHYHFLGEVSQVSLWDSGFQGDNVEIQIPGNGLGWKKFSAIAPLKRPIRISSFQMLQSRRSRNCTTVPLFFCLWWNQLTLDQEAFLYLKNTGSPWGSPKINTNSKTIWISCTWGSERKKKITLVPINIVHQTNFCFSHWSFPACALSTPTISYSELECN